VGKLLSRGDVLSSMKWIALMFAAAVLAGCGSSKSSSSASAPPRSSSTPAASGGGSVSFSEKEYKITPSTATLKAGTATIKVANNGTVPHAFAVQTPAGVVRIHAISPGGSASLTVHLTKAGHYTFFCPLDGHRQLGMVGTLTVGSGGNGSGGAGITTSTSSTSGGAGGGYSRGY
jgi:uncharacterized cupredoxin-like copper-binding protein